MVSQGLRSGDAGAHPRPGRAGFGRSAAAALLWVAAALGTACDGPAGGGGPADPGPDGKAPASPVPIVSDDPGEPVKTRNGLLRGTPVVSGGPALDECRRVLAGQLAKYPPEFVKQVGLKQVVLCGRLTFNDADCGAFADVERWRLCLKFGGYVNPARLRWTIHHEAFHQIDFADDHRLDADPRWEALNPPGFRYTNDAERLQADPDSLVLDEGLAGFLDLYATASVAEDKAEVYACMMIDPDYLERRAATDAVLRGKVERVRAMLDRFGPYRRALTGR